MSDYLISINGNQGMQLDRFSISIPENQIEYYIRQLKQLAIQLANQTESKFDERC